MGKYKYVLTQDYQYQLGLSIDKPFEGIDKKGVRRMSITMDGLLTIYAGYAWDGATAVPDFKGTYYAALVHDALYQFLPHTPLTRKQIDEIFLRQMREGGFKGARLYFWGVRLFGGIFVKLTR